MTMYDTRCSICGKDCEVPFKPNPKRDVACEQCYRGKASAPKVAPSPAAPVSPELNAREAAIVRAIAELLILMR